MFIRFDRMYERDRQTHGHCMMAKAALECLASCSKITCGLFCCGAERKKNFREVLSETLVHSMFLSEFSRGSQGATLQVMLCGSC